MDRTTRRIAWTSAVIHGLVHASVLLLPTLLIDLSHAFHVSLLDVLAVANVMYLVFGMAAIPAGYLADRIGSRTMLMVAAGGCGLSLVLVAAAPTFTVLALGLALLGLCAGIYHPSGLSLLSRGVASGERGRAIGIHGVGGNFGEALAPAFAAVFAATLGWRWGFAAAGALAFGCTLLALTLPNDLHVHAHGRVTFDLRGLGTTLRSFWRSRQLRWLMVAMILGGIVYRGVLTFLPLHGGLRGSYLTSLVLVAGIFAQRFGGELADRLPRERLFLAEVALFAPVLVLLGITSGVGLAALALCFGALWYLAQPLLNALAAAYSDARDHGLLYGVQMAATFGIGSFATTLGGLMMSDSGDTRMAFLGFGGIAILQLVAALALVRTVTPVPARA